MPKGMATTTGVGPDGATVSGVVLKAPSAAITPGSVSPMSGAQYWNQINNGCLSETKSQGWMYNCRSLKKMYNGYADYDFFILTFDGNCVRQWQRNARVVCRGNQELFQHPAHGRGLEPEVQTHPVPTARPLPLGVSYILGFSMNSTQSENWSSLRRPDQSPWNPTQ